MKPRLPGQPLVLNKDMYRKFFLGNYEKLDDLFKDRLPPHEPNTARFFTNSELAMLKDRKIRRIDKDIVYKTNSEGLRCDELSDAHEKHHIIFAGCSFTFGEGLPYKSNWSGQLFEKLNREIGLSGFYNLGYSGGSVDYICNAIYKYIKIFGKPEALFVLFPDFARRAIKYEEKELVIMPERTSVLDMQHAWSDVGGDPFQYQYKQIMNLYNFCIKNNIKMIWSTWKYEDAQLIDPAAPGYVLLSDEIISRNIVVPKHLPKKYYNNSRDKSHPGILYNSSVAKLFKERYDSLFY